MLQHLKNATNVAYTTNGAKVHSTTNSFLLDFFAQGGAYRNKSEDDVFAAFSKAFAEDALLATKLAFYLRDVRGGQGERQTFRTIIKYLAKQHPMVVAKNIDLISFYGRYDDLYALIGTSLEAQAFKVIAKQLDEDKTSEYPSLLAKWLKSENTSSAKSVALAKVTRKALGLSSVDYRKMLTSIRAKIKVVETFMSDGQWGEIDYARVPSQAALNYRTAFYKHDEERYNQYIEAVTKGEKKINASALFPYELVRKVSGWGSDNRTLDAQWKSLPDYIGENAENSIAVVDVSGSMAGLPMDVAVSVGMYLAERNKGVFHDHFITFSAQPQLVQIVGSTFSERVNNIKRANWSQNTNIHAMFRLILNTAVKNKVSQDEMISKLYIISDMQFDAANRGSGAVSATLFDTIRNEYEVAGYKLPHLVFWNVNANPSNQPVTMNEYGVQLVSGCSPSIFTNLLKGTNLSAYDLMLDVLNGERYAKVTI